jgi:orotidine-5'-phosphate decarboxylase
VRSLTPREAIDAGCDYIVVGRPVIAGSDPAAAAQSVLTDVG